MNAVLKRSMLPAQPLQASPLLGTPRALRWRRLQRCLASLMLAVLLPLVLVGCSGVAQPPRATLLNALALQIQLTQGSIAQALNLEAPGLPEVSRVRIEDQRSVTIGEAKGLRLAGHFDWRLADDPIRVDSPFEIYLQRGERGQSWRLARPIAASQDGEAQQWLIDPLPIKS